MVDTDASTNHQMILTTHRRRLAYRLRQQARLGDYTPPDVLIDIEDAQRAICDLKLELRARGVAVDDDPNDDITAIAPGMERSRAEERNRSRMLQKVRDFWIKGVLEQSLHYAALFELGLETRPDAVALPWDVLVQSPAKPAQLLPLGTRMIDVFDTLGGDLLVLGAPGAGKTTMLLELARDLIQRATADTTFPTPIVFNLAAWAERRAPLDAWLVDELNVRYDVPRAVGTSWVAADQVLPLLDGLDEVAEAHRAACVDAINAFRRERSMVPLVVCSRRADYEALTARLRLQGAVLIQPLTPDQIAAYLGQGGPQLAGLGVVLQEDAALRELAETPLLLSIMSLAYQDIQADAPHVTLSLEARRRHLFDTYIRQMFTRRRVDMRYQPEKVVQWLAWLARLMEQRSQSVFFVEQLQPDVVSPRTITSHPSLGDVLWLLLRLPYELLVVFALVMMGTRIRIVESLHWSWVKAMPWFVGSMLLTQYALWNILVPSGLGRWTRGNLTTTLSTGLILGALVGAAFALYAGLSGNELELRTTPNQGVWRSARNALIMWISSGVAIGIGVMLLVVGRRSLDPSVIAHRSWLSDAFRDGALLGAALGLLVVGPLLGLMKGGRTWLSHFLLRLRLFRRGALPWRYVHFLNYATERLFLRRVGGGYVFAHRLLLEHFASFPEPNPKLAVHVAVPPARPTAVVTQHVSGAVLPNRTGLARRVSQAWSVLRQIRALRVGRFPLSCYIFGIDILMVLIVLLWVDLPNGALLRSFGDFQATQEASYISVTFAPDGRTLLANGVGSHLLWTIADGAPVRAFTNTHTVAFAPDSQTIASVSYSSTLTLWRHTDGDILKFPSIPKTRIYSSIPVFTFSPDGQIMAVWLKRGTIQLWNVRDRVLLRTLIGHQDQVVRVVFSPDGQLLASEARDETVRLWRVSDGALLQTFEGQRASESAIHFSPDGYMLAMTPDNRTVQLWDVKGRILHTLVVPGYLWGIEFAPDGQTLAAGFNYHNYSSVYLWHVADGVLIAQFQQIDGFIFGPDGHILITHASKENQEDRRIQLWNAADGSLLTTLSPPVSINPGDIFSRVAFSPDGSMLATGSEDGVARLWHVPNGTLLHSYRLWSAVTSLAFSPDGRMLATGSADGVVQVWRVLP